MGVEMGTFSVDVELGNLNGDEFVTVNALVDTGSTHATVPTSVLQRLRVTQETRRRFRLADNRVVEYATGYVRIRYDGDEAVAPVIFGPEDIDACIGATTLEILSLAVDPLGQTLVQVEGLMKRHGPVGDGI